MGAGAVRLQPCISSITRRIYYGIIQKYNHDAPAHAAIQPANPHLPSPRLAVGATRAVTLVHVYALQWGQN